MGKASAVLPGNSMPQDTQMELERMRTTLINLLASPQPSDAIPERLRKPIWAAARELDFVLDELHIPRSLDLQKGDDPETRQILHDFVVWRYFTPHPVDDPGDISLPAFTPEEGRLSVFYQHGRWFVTWLKLDEDMKRPENDSRELLVIAKEQDGRIVFAEV
jgi:hypothetical protein